MYSIIIVLNQNYCFDNNNNITTYNFHKAEVKVIPFKIHVIVRYSNFV